jgi:hypothetical protein
VVSGCAQASGSALARAAPPFRIPASLIFCIQLPARDGRMPLRREFIALLGGTPIKPGNLRAG